MLSEAEDQAARVRVEYARLSVSTGCGGPDAARKQRSDADDSLTAFEGDCARGKMHLSLL